MKGRKKTRLEPQINSNTWIGDQSVYGKDVRTTKYTKGTRISHCTAQANNNRRRSQKIELILFRVVPRVLRLYSFAVL